MCFPAILSCALLLKNEFLAHVSLCHLKLPEARRGTTIYLDYTIDAIIKERRNPPMKH